MASGFSQNEIDDALRRVENMRHRADSFWQSSQNQNSQKQTHSEPEHRKQNVPKAHNVPHNPPEKKEPLGGFLSNILGMDMDNDMLLILALVILLSQEGANQMLIFALMYILM